MSINISQSSLLIIVCSNVDEVKFYLFGTEKMMSLKINNLVPYLIWNKNLGMIDHHYNTQHKLILTNDVNTDKILSVTF